MSSERTPRSTRPLVSVVIPTKNRYATLLPVLEATLASIPDPSLELIVQDNSDDHTQFLEFLDALGDARLSYCHNGEPVSIVENTEVALDRATGEYVTFIGDDDLVSPFVMDVARALGGTGVEAVTYPSAYYWWRGVHFAKPSRFHQPGALWFPVRTGGGGRRLNPKLELARVLGGGAVSILNLPRLYHGLVRRDLLDKMRRSTGVYVAGASPDLALAVSLGLTVKHHVLIDFPLTVYGASRHSGGGWTVEGKHFGKIEDQAHLPRSTIENWNAKLPRVWSEYTVYPQTAHEVLKAYDMPDDINYTAFYAAMAVGEPQLRNTLYPLLVSHLRHQPGEIPVFVKALARKIGGRLRRAMQRRVLQATYSLELLQTPMDCMVYLSKQSPSGNVSWLMDL